MDTTAMWVYTAIGGTALLFVLISLIIGEIGDFVDDALSPATTWLEGHLPIDHTVEFPRILNAGALLGFVSGFGFTAALAMGAAGISATSAGGIGVVGGALLGALLGVVYRGFAKSTATTALRTADLLGQAGEVTADILPGQIGEVTIKTSNGMRVWYPARGVDDTALSRSQLVEIVDSSGRTLVVKRK
ncbi:MAG: hypothetical protein HY681_07135 [Chloroflexi bacterium]|nr:hypothetical protein [Chloroflexota bacterium]